MLLAFSSFLKTALYYSIYLKVTLGRLNDLEVIEICIYTIYLKTYLFVKQTNRFSDEDK